MDADIFPFPDPADLLADMLREATRFVAARQS